MHLSQGALERLLHLKVLVGSCDKFEVGHLFLQLVDSLSVLVLGFVELFDSVVIFDIQVLEVLTLIVFNQKLTS